MYECKFDGNVVIKCIDVGFLLLKLMVWVFFCMFLLKVFIFIVFIVVWLFVIVCNLLLFCNWSD